ncbi:hypothetical protein Aduo_003806 [Ancylostoma duodenale]
MAGIVGTFLLCLCLSVGLVKLSDILQGDELLTTDEYEAFESSDRLKRPPRRADHEVKAEEGLSSKNNWGFNDGPAESPEKHGQTTMVEVAERTTTPYYEEVDPSRNGLLKDIGSINVGFGVGVGVPGNDPVRVASRVRFSSFLLNAYT